MKITGNDLRNIRFFESYTDKQLDTIASMSTIKEFKVREILFEQYDELSEVYILLQGTLSLGISLELDKRIHLGTVEEGQLFSWSAVFSPYISTAWVMAITPARVIAIDARKLNTENNRDCDFGFKTMSKIALTISQRLSDTRFQLMNQLML
ncbi:MAG: cyclic nucleotide-binding domain-containing protein [Bacteroidales bacterium]|jgi:CRP/FNR family transcriptional regulator|nr:cyclic nucleotide-binding domain-containing protein [Bacteroidales bacterium]